jgi:hypothetical protein
MDLNMTLNGGAVKPPLARCGAAAAVDNRATTPAAPT